MIISLKEALEITEKVDHNGEKVPFSMRWSTANISRRTGGKFLFEENLVRAGLAHSGRDNSTIGVVNDNLRHPVPVHIHLILDINGMGVQI